MADCSHLNLNPHMDGWRCIDCNTLLTQANALQITGLGRKTTQDVGPEATK